MNTFPYGHDFGNSETGGVLIANGQPYGRHIPSVTAPASTKRFEALGNRFGQEGFIFKDDLAELYVGALALEQSTSAYSSMHDIERYASTHSLRLLLTVATALVQDAGMDASEFGLAVVTGLPVDTFLDSPDLRRQVKRLDGSYQFSLNSKGHIAHISMKTVLMEGAGALANKQVTPGSLNAVVDIGGRTTDLYVTRGQVPVEAQCRHKALGVEIAASRLSRTFESLYGRPLSLLETRELLYAYARKRALPTISVDGITVANMREMLQSALREVGEQILSFVSGVWNESETGKVASSFGSVTIIGGGAYYFGDLLKSRIPHAVLVDLPELANALGYARVAERLLQRQSASA